MLEPIARRSVLRAAAGTALLAPAAGPGAAREDLDSEPEHTVVAGPGGELVFDPVRLRVEPGATVRWEWDSDDHTVTPTSQPDAADWEGTSDVHDDGYVHEHTFDVEGYYEYECAPHAAAGMTGEVLVGDAAQSDEPTILVGPDGYLVFEPDELQVEPGTTVTFEWESDSHNVNPTSIPGESTWEGHPEIADPPTVHEHTFDVEGYYEFECTPHVAAGMIGELVVGDPASSDDPTIVVGEDGSLTFEPDELEVQPGTTVRFEWDSPGHNVNPTSTPEAAAWDGHPDVVDDPNVYEHTFETEGVYEFECTSHVAAGMTGRVVVDESAGADDAGADDGGADDADEDGEGDGTDGDAGTDEGDGTDDETATDGDGDADANGDADDGSPGFGVPAALVALGGTLAALRQRLRGD